MPRSDCGRAAARGWSDGAVVLHALPQFATAGHHPSSSCRPSHPSSLEEGSSMLHGLARNLETPKDSIRQSLAAVDVNSAAAPASA